MSDEDDAERIRIEDDVSEAEATRTAPPASGGSVTASARTVNGGKYPTAASSFFLLVPITALGPEIEGGPVTLTPGSAKFAAYNLGRSIPPIGTDILVTYTRHRWVFRYD